MDVVRAVRRTCTSEPAGTATAASPRRSAWSRRRGDVTHTTPTAGSQGSRAGEDPNTHTHSRDPCESPSHASGCGPPCRGDRTVFRSLVARPSAAQPSAHPRCQREHTRAPSLHSGSTHAHYYTMALKAPWPPVGTDMDGGVPNPAPAPINKSWIIPRGGGAYNDTKHGALIPHCPARQYAQFFFGDRLRAVATGLNRAGVGPGHRDFVPPGLLATARNHPYKVLADGTPVNMLDPPPLQWVASALLDITGRIGTADPFAVVAGARRANGTVDFSVVIPAGTRCMRGDGTGAGGAPATWPERIALRVSSRTTGILRHDAEGYTAAQAAAGAGPGAPARRRTLPPAPPPAAGGVAGVLGATPFPPLTASGRPRSQPALLPPAVIGDPPHTRGYVTQRDVFYHLGRQGGICCRCREVFLVATNTAADCTYAYSRKRDMAREGMFHFGADSGPCDNIEGLLCLPCSCN